MTMRHLFAILLLIPALAGAEIAQIVQTNEALAGISGTTVTVQEGYELRLTVYVVDSSDAPVPLDYVAPWWSIEGGVDGVTNILATGAVINAASGQLFFRYAAGLQAGSYRVRAWYVGAETNVQPPVVAWFQLSVTGSSAAVSHPISVYANGPSNFVGLGGIAGGITNDTLTVDGSGIAGTIGGATNVELNASVTQSTWNASTRTLTIWTAAGDTTPLTLRLDSLDGYTNAYPRPLLNETGTAQTVFNRGHAVTGEVDFSAADHVYVPLGDMAPNAAVGRADLTNLISVAVVSGAVTRLMFLSGSTIVTQIANAIAFESSTWSGADVTTNAELVIVTPHLRPFVMTNAYSMPPGPYTTWEDFSADKTWTNSAQGSWSVGVTNGMGYARSTNEASITTRIFFQLPITATNSPWSAAALLVSGPPLNVATYYYWGLGCGIARSSQWTWAANVSASGAAWTWGGHYGTPGAGISSLAGGTTEFPANPSSETLATLGIHSYPYWMWQQYDGTSKWWAGFAPCNGGPWTPYVVQSKTNLEPQSLVGLECTTRASDSNPAYWYVIDNLIIAEGVKWVNL